MRSSSLSMHQADKPRRHVAERGEAPLAGQPFVVDQDHERRHERHEDERGQPSSHRRQERGDPVDYASHPLPHGTPSIRIAEAHGLPFPAGLRWIVVPLRRRGQPGFNGQSAGALAEEAQETEIRREAGYGLNAGDGTTGFALSVGIGPGLRPGLGPPRTVESVLMPAPIADALIVAGVIYDMRTRGRPHPAYLIGDAVADFLARLNG